MLENTFFVLKRHEDAGILLMFDCTSLSNVVHESRLKVSVFSDVRLPQQRFFPDGKNKIKKSEHFVSLSLVVRAEKAFHVVLL